MYAIMTYQVKRLKHDDYRLQDVYRNPKGHGKNEKKNTADETLLEDKV